MDSDKIKFDIENLRKIDKDELLRESDRGLVLIKTSDIENLLGEMLITWFKESSNISNNESKMLFDYSGALGSFSSKILMSKAIGLIDNKLYEDLQTIRKIRNQAAHTSGQFSLSDKSNAEKITNLNYYDYTSKAESLSDELLTEAIPDLDKNEFENDYILTGYGLIRYEKSCFVSICLRIEYDLIRYCFVARGLGHLVNENRTNMLDEFDKISQQLDELRDNNELEDFYEFVKFRQSGEYDKMLKLFDETDQLEEFILSKLSDEEKASLND